MNKKINYKEKFVKLKKRINIKNKKIRDLKLLCRNLILKIPIDNILESEFFIPCSRYLNNSLTKIEKDELGKYLGYKVMMNLETKKYYLKEK